MKKYEDEILEALESEFQGELSIERYPKAIRNYTPTHPRGSILVTFNDEVPDENGNITEHSKIRFLCSVVLRTFAEQYEVYAILDRVRNRLIKHRYTYLGSQFADMKDDQFWVYHINFSKHRTFEYKN